MDFHVVIPARYGSTRLAGKVMCDINGKPMVQHVYENAVKSGAASVMVATDNQEIAAWAEKESLNYCLTSPDHNTGTERVIEAIEAMDYEDYEAVINLQADEPMLGPEYIRQLGESMCEGEHLKVATLATPLTTVDDLFDSSVVKVVFSKRNFAIYFSRSVIPWIDQRESIDKLPDNLHFKHIGIYGYRVGFLRSMLDWVECPLEQAESLEQLRILWNGGRIYVSLVDKCEAISVDTQEDLDRVREIIA